MESFFFNIRDTRYKLSTLFRHNDEFLDRVDISNGVVFLDAKLINREKKVALKNLDRMVMIVMIKAGKLEIVDHLSGQKSMLKTGDIGIYCSSRQDMELRLMKSKQTDVLMLFVADFFLKRYLSGEEREPIDFLYRKLQQEVTLEEINRQPIDALSLYIVEKLLNIGASDRMKSIRAEHLVMEFMIHCFALVDIMDPKISKEDQLLAQRAKAILLKSFVEPPTIKVLAHLCATNETKLKKVFKRVYQSTIYSYIQKLRLEEANLLLKEESLTIGEIAKRVGYKHQGHFSKLFFSTYGIYPTALVR